MFLCRETKSRLPEVKPCGQSRGSAAEKRCFSPRSQLHKLPRAQNRSPSQARGALPPGPLSPLRPGPSPPCAPPSASAPERQPRCRRRASWVTRPAETPAQPRDASRIAGRRLGSGLCPDRSVRPSVWATAVPGAGRAAREGCVPVDPRAAPAARVPRRRAARLPGTRAPPPAPQGDSPPSPPVLCCSVHPPPARMPHSSPVGGRAPSWGRRTPSHRGVEVFQTVSLAET